MGEPGRLEPFQKHDSSTRGSVFVPRWRGIKGVVFKFIDGAFNFGIPREAGINSRGG
jgi:hypothetical protein